MYPIPQKYFIYINKIKIKIKNQKEDQWGSLYEGLPMYMEGEEERAEEGKK